MCILCNEEIRCKDFIYRDENSAFCCSGCIHFLTCKKVCNYIAEKEV
jgi:hypothetical protein